MYQNNNLHILNNNSRAAEPEILMTFRVSQRRQVNYIYYLFFKKVLLILRWHTKHAKFRLGMPFLFNLVPTLPLLSQRYSNLSIAHLKKQLP